MPGPPYTQKVEEKEKGGKKEEIIFLETNTIPNSKYDINFGWRLTFILFCLDEQDKKINNKNHWYAKFPFF